LTRLVVVEASKQATRGMAMNMECWSEEVCGAERIVKGGKRATGVLV
jgi:hypothetical protein